MLNQYAAKAAADAVRASANGDAVGRQSVADQLDAIAAGRWTVVPADACEVETERARRVIAAVHCLLDRIDPTNAEYRGAVLQAKEYIGLNCPWLSEYL